MFFSRRGDNVTLLVHDQRPCTARSNVNVQCMNNRSPESCERPIIKANVSRRGKTVRKVIGKTTGPRGCPNRTPRLLRFPKKFAHNLPALVCT